MEQNKGEKKDSVSSQILGKLDLVKGKNELPKEATATKGFNPVPTGGVVRPSQTPHMPPKKAESKK